MGRLAPSPTGRLHLGNLSSSLLAAAHARRIGAALSYRIEDLDPPRCVDGAAEQQVDDLRWLGLSWDHGPDVGGPAGPYVQSERRGLHDAALDQLRAAGLAYRCFCSRREVEEALSAPHTWFDPALAYPGTCAALSVAEAEARATTEAFAWRFRAVGVQTVVDEVHGRFEVDVATNPGDFVLVRKDGLVGYQHGVVVDDAAMGVTHVVRGYDLLDSAARQVALFRALGAPPPTFVHVPLLVDARGERLSKRSGSVARDGLEAAGWTPALLRGGLATLWGWTDTLDEASLDAVAALWDAGALRRAELRVPDAFFEGPKAWARWLARSS